MATGSLQSPRRGGRRASPGCGCDRVGAVPPSGTQALELAVLLLEIEPGDEVIGPSFTFPSTLNAFVLHGARPVFADIRPDTLNIDERTIEELITERTKAIVCTHYGGDSATQTKKLKLKLR